MVDHQALMGVVLPYSKRYIFAGDESGSVNVWAVGSGDLLHTLRGRGGGDTGSSVSGIAVSGGGKIITSHNNG